MKQKRHGYVRPCRSQVWGTLALGLAGWFGQPALGAPQAGDPAAQLAGRFQAWRLGVATGVMTSDARAELDALAKQAQAEASKEGATNAVQDVWAQVQAEQKAIAPKAAVAANQNVQDAPEEEVLNRSILASLKSGNQSFIDRLGSRAVPALTALAKATDGSPIPEGTLDPLDSLFRVDISAGMDTALELMASKSFLVKRATIRVVDTFCAASVLFEPVGESDWAFKNPDWIRIVLLAVEEPAISPKAMPQFIKVLLTRGLLPRELVEVAMELMPNFRYSGVVPQSGLWFIEHRLAHPSANVRSSMVEQVARAGIVAPLFPLVNDPSPDVRMRVANELLRPMAWEYKDRSIANSSYDATRVYLPFDPPLFEAFKALATSENKDVANKIWSASYGRLEDPEATKLNADQLRALIPSAKTSYQLNAIAWHAKAVPESERLSVVKGVIAELAKRDFTKEQIEGIQSLVVRLAEGDLDLDPSVSFWALMNFMEETLGVLVPKRVSITAAALAGEGKIAAAPLVGWLARHGEHGHWQIYSYQNGDWVLSSWMAALTQAERGQAIKVYSRQFDAEDSPNPDFQPARIRSGTVLSDAKVLRAVLADVEVTPRSRVWAAQELLAHHPQAIDQSVVVPIADALARHNHNGRATGLLTSIPQQELANQVMRAIVRHPESTDAMILVQGFAPDDATFDALVTRFPMDTWGGLGFQNQIWQCLKVLIHRSIDEQHPMLETICFSVPKYTHWTAAEISAVRSPALLPLASRILKSSQSGSETWKSAVDAIAGYFNEDAAAALLEAAKAAKSESSRQRVMSAIRQITEWREAAAAWEKGVGAEAKRAKAIEDLIATLEDAKAPLEARAASMRGLGLLGAVEELPRIIAGLSSAEGEIQAAARAALKRLEQ